MGLEEGYPYGGYPGYPEPGAGYPEPGALPRAAGAGYPEPGAGYPEPGVGYPEPGVGYPEPGAGRQGYQRPAPAEQDYGYQDYGDPGYDDPSYGDLAYDDPPRAGAGTPRTGDGYQDRSGGHGRRHHDERPLVTRTTARS